VNTAYERLIDRLRADGRKVKPDKPNHVMASCPGPLHKHGDRNPSLSITRIEGEVLVRCFVGCGYKDIAAALGWTPGELLHDDPRGATYVYPDGRTEHKYYDHKGAKRFRQTGVKGETTRLYKADEIKAANVRGDTIYLCEGVKDVRAVEAAGGIATTAPQGGDNFHLVDVSPLHGGNVKAIVDKDRTGDKWGRKVRDALKGKANSLEFLQAKTGKDAADHIAAGHTLEDFEPYIPPDPEPPDAGQQDKEDQDVRSLLPRIDWHALWANEEEEEFISYPLIPRRRLIAIYSSPKVGKSLLMLELAAAVSCGRTVLGHTPSKRYRVLYVDFENDPRGDIRPRLEDMGYEPDNLDHLDYLSFPSLSALDSERGGWELLAATDAYGSEFVVIDTISRAVAGEENSNDTWLDFYRHTGLKLKQAGVTLIRLDHSGKDDGKGQRGGSAKAGDVDAVWWLTKVTDERFRLECTYTRPRLDTKSLHLTRQSDPLRHDVDNLSGITDREAKIAHIVKEADDARLPADTSRRDLQAWGKLRGTKARNDVWTEAARLRKVVPEPRGPRDSHEPENPSGTNGDQPPENTDSEREKWSRNPRGPAGTTDLSGLVPGPPTVGGDQGTAEPCASCAQPFDQPNSLCSLADYHGSPS
jgi:hypothetical protein